MDYEFYCPLGAAGYNGIAGDYSRTWWAETNDKSCTKIVATHETPIRQLSIMGDLENLNANNDCEHFKEKT